MSSCGYKRLNERRASKRAALRVDCKKGNTSLSLGVFTTLSAGLAYVSFYFYRLGEARVFGIPEGVVSISVSDMAALFPLIFFYAFALVLCGVFVFWAFSRMEMSMPRQIASALLAIVFSFLLFIGAFYVVSWWAAGMPDQGILPFIAIVMAVVYVISAIVGLKVLCGVRSADGKGRAENKREHPVKRFLKNVLITSAMWLSILVTSLVVGVAEMLKPLAGDVHIILGIVLLFGVLVLLARSTSRIDRALNALDGEIEKFRKSVARKVLLMLLLASALVVACPFTNYIVGETHAKSEKVFLILTEVDVDIDAEQREAVDGTGALDAGARGEKTAYGASAREEEGATSAKHYCALVVYDGDRAIAVECRREWDGEAWRYVRDRGPYERVEVFSLSDGAFSVEAAECEEAA